MGPRESTWHPKTTIPPVKNCQTLPFWSLRRTVRRRELPARRALDAKVGHAPRLVLQRLRPGFCVPVMRRSFRHGHHLARNPRGPIVQRGRGVRHDRVDARAGTNPATRSIGAQDRRGGHHGSRRQKSNERFAGARQGGKAASCCVGVPRLVTSA